MKKGFLPLSLLLAIMIFGQTITIADNGGHYVPRTQDAATAEQFLSSLRANQNTGLIDPALVIKAMQDNAKSDPVAPNDPLYWLSMGPDNMGGQTTAVMYDNRSNQIYIGSKGGGVYKSYNAGITWHQVGNTNLMVSCLTQAADGTIYVGTGDASPALTYNGLDLYGLADNSFVGTGIYKIDGNDVITKIAATDPATDPDFSYVNEIAVVGNTLVAATNAALKYSTDNGATWETLIEGAAREVKPMGNSIVASVARKLYIGDIEEMTCLSTNNNNPGYEDEVMTLIPRAGNFVDFATDNDQIIYAALITNAGNQKGIYVSRNKGQSWEVVSPEISVVDNLGHIVYGSRGLYNYGLVIDPTNSNRVFVTAKDLWVLEKPQAEGYYVARCITSGLATTVYSSDYIHTGIHDMRFNPNNNKEFFIGTDGGVFKGTFSNGDITTYNCNRNYITTRMLDVAYSTESARILASGLDHGTVYIEGKANTNTEGYAQWINPNGYVAGVFDEDGQGGSCAMSMLNPNTIFVTYKGGNLRRSQTTGEDWVSVNFTSSNITLNNTLFRTPVLLYETDNDPNSTKTVWFNNTTGQDLSSGTQVECESVNHCVFMHTLATPLAAGDSIEVIDPITAKFFVATKDAVYMAYNALQFEFETEWLKISSSTGTPIGMAISADGNHLFVSTKENGKVIRVSNLNSIVDGNLDDVTVTSLTVASGSQAATSVALDPRDANKLVVTMGNYGNENYVYYSENALAETPTFTSKQANLPKVPVFSSIIDMTTGQVILGTEKGIYRATSISNPNWVADGENMGDVPVISLKQQTMKLDGINNTGIIYAATYGRGVFRCENFKLSNEGVDESTTTADASVSIYPNPVHDRATISFEADGNQPVSYQVYDLAGRMVQSETMGNFGAGSHEHSVDLGNLGAGSYILRVEQGQRVSTAKFIVY